MSWWKLEKEFRFEASHVLPNHNGKCARLHGHSWRMMVRFEGAALHDNGPETGMLVDFARIKEFVQPVVDQYLDHHHLNETTELVNPTSESLAAWVFEKVRSVLPDDLYSAFCGLRIEETCTSACEYQP